MGYNGCPIENFAPAFLKISLWKFYLKCYSLACSLNVCVPLPGGMVQGHLCGTTLSSCT